MEVRPDVLATRSLADARAPATSKSLLGMDLGRVEVDHVSLAKFDILPEIACGAINNPP
jgi:hypothetical protein